MTGEKEDERQRIIQLIEWRLASNRYWLNVTADQRIQNEYLAVIQELTMTLLDVKAGAPAPSASFRSDGPTPAAEMPANVISINGRRRRPT